MGKKSTLLLDKRDEDLFAAYCKAIDTYGFSSQDEATDYVRTHEAPQFYISPEFCMTVLGRMSRGEDSGIKRANARRKFEELFCRYKAERKKPENIGLGYYELCSRLVQQPAPEFYLNNRMARGIIQKQKRKRQEAWKKRQEG